MRQVAGLIPTYSSDEFGICSALYELGGMVVMHDASGCNSTYTTHDEPRWYDMDSMIFISAISEMEAIMGDDEKFIGDLIETANELHPRFIAIVGAPIPYMIGTDFRAIASIVEAETDIPCLGFEANGMHDYTRGVSWALKAVVEHFCEDQCLGNRSEASMAAGCDSVPEMDRLPEKSSCTERSFNKRCRVNIIGATPLDFSLNGSINSIKAWLLDHDFEVNCCMAMGSSLEEISRAGQADVNLVISATGFSAAEALQKKFGQPYVAGLPVKAPDTWEIQKDDKVLIIGEAVYGTSLAQTIDCAQVTVACPLEHHQGICVGGSGQTESILGIRVSGSGQTESILGISVSGSGQTESILGIRVSGVGQVAHLELNEVNVLSTPEEDDIMKAIEDADVVIADPFYEVLVRSVEVRIAGIKNAEASGMDGDGKTRNEIRFIDLPHEAFSGRIYDAVNPNLIGESTFSQELIQRLRETK